MRGYVCNFDPERLAHRKRYVYEHVLVAENALGRVMPAGAVVHHVNGDPSNNTPGNLIICQDQKYHMGLHRRERALRASGHAHYRSCRECSKYSDPATMKRWGRNIAHYECAAPGLREGKHRSDAKLGPNDVRAIREALATGECQRTIAERFGVTRTAISAIAIRRNWGWLDAPWGRARRRLGPKGSDDA